MGLETGCTLLNLLLDGEKIYGLMMVMMLGRGVIIVCGSDVIVIACGGAGCMHRWTEI